MTQVTRLVLSGTVIRRKRHESVMSSVMESGLKRWGVAHLSRMARSLLLAMKIDEQTCLVMSLQHQAPQRPLGSAWSFETGEASLWTCCSTG